MSRRFPELDLLRTVAILCMVAYHGAYDLAFFHYWDIPVMDGGWHVFQVCTASLFLLLVGAGFAVGSKGKADDALWRAQRKRFLRIGAAALLVSVATWIFDSHTYVRFGVLHLIAVSALLLPLARRLGTYAIVAGIAGIIFAGILRPTEALQPLAMILGLPPPGFLSADYFPLLPWFGVILIGYGLGHAFYASSTDWRLAAFDHIPAPVTWPGKHSLAIYLVHQPILLAILSLIF